MRNLVLVLACVLTGTFASCSSKKFVYWEDIQADISYPVVTDNNATVHADDRLSIVVSSKKPELAIPFNVKGGMVPMGIDGKIQSDALIEKPENNSYKVDSDGFIDFPILGRLYVATKTLDEVSALIKKKIQEGNYIKEPIVSVEFLNFQYTVLGAVGHTGKFTANDGKVTLLDAIAIAGDLAANACTNHVEVIRVENSIRRVYVHDLNSKAVFDSPAYNLQQNDIVYVKPRYRKKSTEDRGVQYITMFLSLVATACTMIWAFK